MAYLNYDDYTFDYNEEQGSFSVQYKDILLLTEGRIDGLYSNGEKVHTVSDFPFCTSEHRVSLKDNAFEMRLHFRAQAEDEKPAFSLCIFVSTHGIRMTAHPFDACLKGHLLPNVPTKNLLAVCVDRDATDVRASLGEAIQPIDHALYNKMTDTAVIVGRSGKTTLQFDRSADAYRFVLPLATDAEKDDFLFYVCEHVLAEKYHIHFSPYNRNSTFPTPPIGWMTWYAVKFDACEEVVLKNAEWQAKNLKDYGANTIWVDWEWYHCAFPGERNDGVNSLMPDPQKYPHGLKYLADRIKDLGLIPSLWIGYTNEPDTNEFIEKYPDIVLADKTHWCGHYFYDYTNPHYLNEYLPLAVNNVHKWGYQAVKYDTIPSSISMHNKYRKNMYDRSITVKEAFCNMVKKTRELLGENVYMLSCSGANNASVLWASDVFDAARIGDDIFTWEEHLTNIGRIQEFYPLHNIQMHVDADNVILREEYNEFEQAKARVTIVSLLGLPMTFGDEFEVLQEERVALIKRSLPILDIHPKDLTTAPQSNEHLLINLSIAKPYESYQVTGTYNLTDHELTHTLRLTEDLHLPKDTYLVYDFFRDEFLGAVQNEVTLTYKPYEGRILALRPHNGVPQIISTSRHITQGAAEITAMQFTENTLSFTADLIAGDRYTVTVFVPNGYRLKTQNGFSEIQETEKLIRFSYVPTETVSCQFEIFFEK